MGANEEQIQFLVSEGVDHVSYTLVIFSLAFFVYFCIPFDPPFLILVILFLIWLYSNSGRNRNSDDLKFAGGPNGASRDMTSTDQRRMRDVEEFELGALLEEDEEEEADKRDSGSENTPLTKRSSIERD
jgi:hypothetical protein